MAGLLGYFGEPLDQGQVESLTSSIDLLSLCDSRWSSLDKGLWGVAWHKQARLSSCFHENDQYLIACCGDLAITDAVVWEEVIAALEHRNSAHFSTYRGTFVFSALDKIRKRAFLVSDRFSHYPLFYTDRDGFIYSTSLATFCRLDSPPRFNRAWLYEFLYFNYPVGQTTFLEGVQRMPPATIVEYDLQARRCSMRPYAEGLRRPSKLIAGREAFEKAFSVFSEHIPRYFKSQGRKALSLTAGLDSRTVLSFAAPEWQDSLATYTYGIDGCADLVEAGRIAQRLPFPHLRIVLGEEFLDELPTILLRAIHLSGGLERVSRSTLEYVYRTLTDQGRNFSMIITGVSGDHLFRDHIRGRGNVPALISQPMMDSFQSGAPTINPVLFKRVFGTHYHDFLDHITGVFSDLQIKYGPLHQPQTYLNYLVYETGPKHFCGEAAIATNYATFTSPYWNSDIVQLAYDLEYGTMGLSEALPRKDPYAEKILQSYVITRTPFFAGHRLQGLPIELFSNGNKNAYALNRFIRKAPARLCSLWNRSRPVHIEDWPCWFRTALKEQVDTLLSDTANLNGYIDSRFVDHVRTHPLSNGNDLQWLSKCLTAEIILTLSKNQWLP